MERETCDFVVRPVAPADHDDVRRLVEEILCEELGLVEDLSAETDLVDIGIAYAPPRSCMLVAECINGIVGMVGLRRLSDEDCELTRLYVREDCRRQGVAAEMAGKLLDFVKQQDYGRLLFQLRPELKDVVRNPERFGLLPESEGLPREGEFLSIRFR